jgi:hypothetical protein
MVMLQRKMCKMRPIWTKTRTTLGRLRRTRTMRRMAKMTTRKLARPRSPQYHVGEGEEAEGVAGA